VLVQAHHKEVVLEKVVVAHQTQKPKNKKK
jgi:hypothetical protein